MALVVELGPWQVAISTDVPSAIYEARHWFSASVPKSGTPVERRARAIIELRRVSGGVVPHALIGGELVPADGESLSFEVGVTDELGLGGVPTCVSSLSQRSLVPGLPPEFAQAALDGLVRVPKLDGIPAGVVRVDRGAYDEVDSSQIAFELAAGLLLCVLLEGAAGRPPEPEVKRHLASW